MRAGVGPVLPDRHTDFNRFTLGKTTQQRAHHRCLVSTLIRKNAALARSPSGCGAHHGR
jgi:hypothetical protein